MLKHPFSWLKPSQQKTVFVILTGWTVVMMVMLTILGVPLKTEHAPQGIISFEFAKTPLQAQQMMSEWGAGGQVYAALNLGLDYLFLVLYPSSIALGCALIANKMLHRQFLFSMIGIMLSWAQLGAAGLDAVENAALITVLLGSQQPAWPELAWWCALVKFLIVFAGLIYVLGGAGLILAQKLFTGSRNF